MGRFWENLLQLAGRDTQQLAGVDVSHLRVVQWARWGVGLYQGFFLGELLRNLWGSDSLAQVWVNFRGACQVYPNMIWLWWDVMKGNKIIRSDRNLNVTQRSTNRIFDLWPCARSHSSILLTAQHPKHHSDQVQAFDVCQPPAVCGFSKAAWYDGRLFKGFGWWMRVPHQGCLLWEMRMLDECIQ